MRRFFACNCLFIMLLATVLATTSAPSAVAAGWKAGVASRAITPEKPMWMAGYASRNKPSEGKVHDLFIKALAIEDPQGGRVVIVTSDLISVPRPLRDAVQKAVAERYELPAESLLINCSHTHCGPEIRTTRWSLDGLPPDRYQAAIAFAESLQKAYIDLVGEALSKLTAARIEYCRARCGFAMNRRTPTATGTFRNFPNPDGPVDHDVPVLRVLGEDNKLRAVLFCYACHNTTLGFYKFCGDYAGFAQAYLEQSHPGAVALFMSGCGGDQNPYPRRTLPLAEQHGRTLANAVETALLTEGTPLSGPLRSAYEMASLRYSQPPTREQLQQKAKSSNVYDRRHAERLLKQLDDEGQLRSEYECPIQVVRFGDTLILIALPGETVVDYALRLKSELGSASGPAIWVAGYSNDVFAYLPSRRVLLEGGYEAGGAMRYMTTVLQHGPFAPDVEERVIAKVMELHRRLQLKPATEPAASERR